MARKSTGEPQANTKVIPLRFNSSRNSGSNNFPSNNDVDEGSPGPSQARLRPRPLRQPTPDPNFPTVGEKSGRKLKILDNPKDKTYEPDDGTDEDDGDESVIGSDMDLDSLSGPEEVPEVDPRTPVNQQSQADKKVQQESTQRKRAPSYEHSISPWEGDTIVVNTKATHQPKLGSPAESKAKLKGARQEHAQSTKADFPLYKISIFNEMSDNGCHVEMIRFEGDNVKTVTREINARYHNSSTSKQDRNHWLSWVKLTDRQRNGDYHNSFDIFQEEMRGGEETDGQQTLKRKRETKVKGKNKKQRR